MKTPILVLTALLSAAAASAQSTWTNASTDTLFSTAGNWQPLSVPVSGAAISINSSDPLVFDSGESSPFVISTLTVLAGVTANLATIGSESVEIGSGGVINQGGGLLLDLYTFVASSQTWNVGSGAFSVRSGFEVSNAALVVDLGAGGTFDFASGATDPDWTGTLAFQGTIGAASIAVSGMGLSAQNIGQITINGAPVMLSGGFLVASAIPEPATVAMFAGLGVLALAVVRRRFAKRA